MSRKLKFPKARIVGRRRRRRKPDLLACLMTGVESLGQIDARMRRDNGLTRELRRESLADQSLLSQTLDAFQEASLLRLRLNIVRLIRARGRTARRIASRHLTILDMDMTDLRTPAYVRRRRSGPDVDFHAEAAYYQQLVDWKRKSPMLPFRSKTGTILYKTR